MKTFKFEVETPGIRLDKTISDNFPELSRMQVKQLLADGMVLVDEHVHKASYKVKAGESITVKVPAEKPVEIKPKQVDFVVVYQDAHLMVVDKPTDLIVHPSSTSEETTLVHGLLQYLDKDVFTEPLRPGIVHRLDKDTSGLMLVAKTQAVLEKLQADLQARKVKRKYQAIIEGVVPHQTGKIDAPIGRHPKKRHLMSVTAEGKPSITHFRVIKRFSEHTLVECELETGRTHQIRVHMQYIGHPVVGDQTYGFKKRSEAYGQYLHATELSFVHPITAKALTFTSALPTIFVDKLNSIR